MRILALVTFASIVAALFGGELLDTIGVRASGFRSHRRVADAVRLRDCHPAPGLLIVRTVPSTENASIP